MSRDNPERYLEDNPEPVESRHWIGIKNLDQFFTSLYKYLSSIKIF